MIEANAGGWVLLIGYPVITFAVFLLALRRGRNRPGLTRGDYLRGIIGIYAISATAVILILVLQSRGLFLCAVPGLFVGDYYRVRFSVQRLSDIDGTPYAGFFRAFLSLSLVMVIYLCLHRGRGLPRLQIEVF